MDAAMEARTRILVVEDNPLNRELVVDLLEAEGGSTDTARFSGASESWTAARPWRLVRRSALLSCLLP